MIHRPTKVLVVEDSQSLNEVVSTSITEQLGLQVDSVKTLQDAISLVSPNKNEYLVAIVDLNLPDAPNGEVVDALISLGIRPIILTASISNDTHEEMLEKPIIDYVVKRNLNEIQYVIDVIKRLNENFNRKVLVVDDSKTSRALLQSLLERHYLQVVTACSGPEALEILDKENDFCLVITDYNMPEMNGPELIAKIREQYTRHQLSIIGVSTAVTGMSSIKMLKSGANDFISRPFLHEEFYCRVNQNIDVVSFYKKHVHSSND